MRGPMTCEDDDELDSVDATTLVAELGTALGVCRNANSQATAIGGTSMASDGSSTEERKCPKCGSEAVAWLSSRGEEETFECRRCLAVFQVSTHG